MFKLNELHGVAVHIDAVTVKRVSKLWVDIADGRTKQNHVK